MITDFLVCATARGARLFVAQKKIGYPGGKLLNSPHREPVAPIVVALRTN